MKDELYQLVHKERPEVVNVVSWATETVIAQKMATICMVSGDCVKLIAAFGF